MAYNKKKSTKLNEECFSYISNKVKTSDGNTSEWSANQEKWNKLRMRIKKSKTFPFVGSSNLRMPTAETKLRKLKAALVNSAFGIRPIVQVIPQPGGNQSVALKIEKFIDHLCMDIIGLYNKSVIAIDQMIEKGFYLFKPYWKTEIVSYTETIKLDELSQEEVAALSDGTIPRENIIEYVVKKFDIDTNKIVLNDNLSAVNKAIEELTGGKKEVVLKLSDVTYDFPDVALVSPERCYVNTDAGVDPQKCDFIVHEFFLSYDKIKSKTEKSGWDADAINGIAETANTGDEKLTDTQKDSREGIERLNDSNLVKVWEYYGWYDINNDGIPEKCVITVLPEFSKVVKKVILPFDNNKFPFVKIMYELTDDRWFSHRGIPEILEDIIKEIDVQHNQKIDNQTIRNAPMFKYRPGMVNPNLVKFIPGQGIPVNGMSPLNDSIDIMNNSNQSVEFSYEREQMLLESKTEELIGQVDYTLQSMINKRQPRTLGEVQLQNQNMQLIFSLDAGLLSNQMSELFSWIWELWCQYGNDEYEFSYFGKNGVEPIRLTKEEVQGKYKIVVRGNDQNTNPHVRLQKAQQVLMAITNPVFLQTGVITPQQQANGLALFYQELDVPNWENLVNLQIQPPQPPQPPRPIDIIKPKFEDMTDAEQAQVLMSGGIQPDAMGRSMNKKLELAELTGAFDQDNSIGGEV